MNHNESGLELLKVLEQSNNECSRNGIIFLRICYCSRKRNGISLTVSAQISPYVDGMESTQYPGQASLLEHVIT